MHVTKRSSFGFVPPSSPSPSPRPRSVSAHNATSLGPVEATSPKARGPEGIDPMHVKVVVRIRPSIQNDASIPPRFLRTVLKPTSDAEVKLDVDAAMLTGHGLGGTAGPSGPKKAPSFSFDRVLPEDSSQLQVYEATALSAVDKFMKGFNVTVLAYGQTSSGKSYSMGTTGVETDYSTISQPSSPSASTSSKQSISHSSRIGIIPRAVSDIFERAEQIRSASGPGASYEAKLSFLELYNEDLIDLLGTPNGPQVQIREDRDGRIIWSGLKEVKVKNTDEVMRYLKEGSARRRTGETGMNATSSRSHAIFSLSLVQHRKATLTPSSGHETPRGKAGVPRPISTTGLPRSMTPSGSRPQTPGTYTPVKSGLMRPASLYAGRPSSPAVIPAQAKDDEEEWVTITAKFNMVDLAGSERLKRTAAQGERMKEGISINSGLLALGNVISALGDPAKARTMTYIPYRDSKLTRLLQDSLGGNAYTVMVACVSPIEFNAGETLSTLKYAARARNIKNLAKANQVEAGWDDVEHLQSTVLKLRKEMSALKHTLEESGKGVDDLNAVSENHLAQSTRASHRVADIMRDHDELNRQLLEKSGEIARLTSQIQTNRASGFETGSDFREAVAPIIAEYEKTVAGFEARIQNLQTNLTMSNDIRDEQEELLDELDTRQLQQEAYISELKARVSRLSEREASHEGYIRELEYKLKLYAEKEDSTSEAVAELRNEITRCKDVESQTALYVAELEGRLSRSDAETSDLRKRVETFEEELKHRDDMYRDLEARMALLDTTVDTKQLLSELEGKERKVADLERQLQGALQGRDQVECEVEKLLEASKLDQVAREELNRQINELQAARPHNQNAFYTSRTPSSTDNFLTPSIQISQPLVPDLPPHSSGSDEDDLTTPDASDGANGGVSKSQEASLTADFKQQLQELQMRQAATLSELSEVSSRHRDALREIDDLAVQLKEAKLEHVELADVPPSSPSASVPEGDEDSSSSSASLSPRASPRKRNLHGQTSAGSLYDLGSHQDFQQGRGSSETNRVSSQSLSQELSSAPLSPSSHSSWAESGSLLSPSLRQGARLLPSSKTQRSVQSLEQEVMSLQKALKDREVEFRHLENSMKQSHGIPSRRNSATILPLQESCGRQNGILLPAAIPLPSSPASLQSLPSTPSRSQISTPEPNHTHLLNSSRLQHEAELQLLQRQNSSLTASVDALTAKLAEAHDTLRSVQSATTQDAKERKNAEAGLVEALEAMHALEDVLQESEAERGSLKNELSQLRFELSTSRDACATVAQSAIKQEARVSELERRLAEVNAAKEAADAQLPASVISPAAGRFSLGRSASPNGSQVKHPPPLAPPPSIPPPPVPMPTVLRKASIESNGSRASAELKAVSHVEESHRLIATLNKKLLHCEADLQANIDMVNTLESALNDSERNLRKARLQSTEMARERDALSMQADTLRRQLLKADEDVKSARNSVTSERQGLEKRLQEEQQAKEHARAQLEARVLAIQNKSSKFQCF